MITKKGISPLIATVLIIGFVIVLAALVMQWGTGLFEGIKEETSISSEVNLICSTGLSNLKVTGAKLDAAGALTVTIDNSNEQELTGFLFRGHLADGNVVTAALDDPLTDSLEAFGAKQYTPTLTGIAVEDEVGVMAIVTVSDGSKHTCTNEKKSIVIAAA